MPAPLIQAAFDHHVWATVRLLDTCSALEASQLESGVPGTYGSVLETLRHVVQGDADYLAMLRRESVAPVDTSDMGLAELKATMESNGAGWTHFLRGDLDAGAVVRDVDEDGYQRDAPVGIRLAQALHHGNDHRSQVCTGLTALGIEPPYVSAWRFGLETGQVIDTPPAS